MKYLMSLSVFVLATVGLFSSCSSDDDNNNAEIKNWIKCDNQKTEIQLGYSEVRDLEEWASISFLGKGFTITKTDDGKIKKNSIKGIGDYVSFEIFGYSKITAGTFVIGQSTIDGKTVKVKGEYVKDLDYAASMATEYNEYIGSYFGTFVDGGIIIIAKSEKGYSIKISADCVDKAGVVKNVTLQYDDQLAIGEIN